MAGAFSAGLPSALLPWHAMHGANSSSPSAASAAPLQINSKKQIHDASQILHEKRHRAMARLFGNSAAVGLCGDYVNQ